MKMTEELKAEIDRFIASRNDSLTYCANMTERDVAKDVMKGFNEFVESTEAEKLRAEVLALRTENKRLSESLEHANARAEQARAELDKFNQL